MDRPGLDSSAPSPPSPLFQPLSGLTAVGHPGARDRCTPARAGGRRARLTAQAEVLVAHAEVLVTEMERVDSGIRDRSSVTATPSRGARPTDLHRCPPRSSEHPAVRAFISATVAA